MKQNFFLLAPSPHYQNRTVFPSLLTTPQCPPPLRLRVWVSSSTAHFLSTPTLITSLGLHISIYVILIASAPLSPLTPLPSWFTASSPPVWITSTHSSLVSPTNPSINFNWSRTQQKPLLSPHHPHSPAAPLAPGKT